MEDRDHGSGRGDEDVNTSTPALILTEGVTKVYNPRRPDEVVAVDGVSMQVGKGEVVVLQRKFGLPDPVLF